MTTALQRFLLLPSTVALAFLGFDVRLDAQSSSPGDVRVSFLAIGRDGKPLPDVKNEEVQIRVNGRQRTIKSLQRVDSVAATADSAKAAAPLPPPFGTNTDTVGSGGTTGRTMFFVIDDASFRPGNERLTKQSIEQYLATASPSDRVALVTTPHPTIRTDPTSSAEVRTALARVAGIAAQRPTDDEVSCRTRETLEALRALFASIAASRSPSTVVFFSTGLSASTRITGKMGPSSCDLSTDHFQHVGAAAGAAGSHVYVIQGDINVAQRSDGLENLAGVVGAQVIVLAASPENPLNRIAVETSSAYVATFDPEPSERNGQSHRLEVRLTRPDTTVHAGTQLSIASASAQTAKKGSANPRDMLRETTVHRDLPLRVAGFTSREAGDKVKIVVLGEPIDPATKLTAALVGVYDAKGRLSQSTAQPEALSTMPVMFAIVVTPGPHRIRLAAADASGRGGTADYEINADLATAGALKLSTLLLGVNDVGFKPVLEFKDEPTAFATFELYGKPPTTMPLKLELAATPDGPAIQQAQPSGSGTKDPDRFVVSGAFQIASLPPGDYVVRAIVGSADTGGEGRIMRTLRKGK
jgi:hypothetical protein